MARIRSIKPEFPQSESMGRVSRAARLTFVLLWTIADDEGRLRGNSRMLASLLFPYDNDAPGLIDEWMEELEQERCIQRYQANDASYVQVLNWLNHQKIDKPSKSKIPKFDEASRLIENIREVSSADQGSKDQGSKEGKGRGGRSADASLKADFQIWYLAFPIHVAPADAERAYLKARKSADAETLLAAAKAYAAKPDRDPKFTKHPATWLNKQCWLDESSAEQKPKLVSDPDAVLKAEAWKVNNRMTNLAKVSDSTIVKLIQMGLTDEKRARAYGWVPRTELIDVASNTRRDVA